MQESFAFNTNSSRNEQLSVLSEFFFSQMVLTAPHPSPPNTQTFLVLNFNNLQPTTPLQIHWTQLFCQNSEERGRKREFRLWWGNKGFLWPGRRLGLALTAPTAPPSSFAAFSTLAAIFILKLGRRASCAQELTCRLSAAFGRRRRTKNGSQSSAAMASGEEG